MTEENYNYRTSQTFLRNQFSGNGKLQIPIIPKFQSKPGDFDDLLLVGFDKTHLEDQNHLDRMVHFFLYIQNITQTHMTMKYIGMNGVHIWDRQSIIRMELRSLKDIGAVIWAKELYPEIPLKKTALKRSAILSGLLNWAAKWFFSWNGVQYGVFGNREKYCIALSDGSAEKWYNTADEVLEYMVGSDRLRDIITQVTVLDRTI